MTTTFRGRAAVAGRAIPAQIRRSGAALFAPEPPPGHVYTARGRRDWNFTTKLSAASNAVRFDTDTSDHRLIISGLSIAMLLAGGAGHAFGWSAARALGLAFYVFVGIGGAPWVLARRMRLPTRMAMTALATLAVPTFVGSLMLGAGAWHPALAFVALAALSLPLHVYGCHAALRDRKLRAQPGGPSAPRPGGGLRRLVRKHVNVSLLLSMTGGLCCLVAALTHRHLDPALWGFLPRIGPLWYAGLALVVIAFAVSRAGSDASVAVAALILLLVLTGTPALVYDGPRSPSAAKHVEFVQQIRTLHRLDTPVAVYNAWPGYFAAMAWLCDVAGLRDPMRLALWWPAIIGFFKLAGLRFLAGTLVTSRTVAWVAVALAVVADPIGADYFSPQSVGFVLGLLAFAIALSHYDWALKATALTAAGCALAVSHQLSPYIVGGTLAILAVLRQVRPWWLPLTVLAPAMLWASLHWSALSGFVTITDVGNARNFRPPATTTADGLHRLPVVGISAGALAAGILLLGAAAGLVLIRRRRSIEVWALAAAPAAGLSIIAVNPYGQEGIFRAALFGIPWLALLAAQLFHKDGDGERAPNGRLLISLGVLCTTFLTASFGLDSINVIRPDDRAAARAYLTAPLPAGQTAYLLQIGPGDLPSGAPGTDVWHQSVPATDLQPPGPPDPDEPPARTEERLTAAILTRSGEDPATATVYAIWSPSSSYYAWAYGLDTPERFAAVRDAFRTSLHWSVAGRWGETVLFRYRNVPAR
jgi:hypothetical protein